MCGIVGGVTERSITPILLEGLRRLEYRGYDSAGLAVLEGNQLSRRRAVGKVSALVNEVQTHPVIGHAGIAHTRWATHGEPAVKNAHPHTSGSVAVVHNGIIENFEPLKAELIELGYVFSSDTDTEVVAHLVEHALKTSAGLLSAVQSILPRLKGAFALAVMSEQEPGTLIAARLGSPLVIGLGIGENFLASDQLALIRVTNRFMFLDEGDVAKVTLNSVQVFAGNQPVERSVSELDVSANHADKGEYKHFMHKEIHEQPLSTLRTLAQALDGTKLNPQFLIAGSKHFASIEHVQILACGTSFFAGLTARYWIEGLLGLPCSVEIASEFRYRKTVTPKNTLLVCVSQSGETADTLAALRALQAEKPQGLTTMTVCNVATSSMVRETDLTLLTDAGPEIGVASTKAFTAQLTALLLLTLKIGEVQRSLSETVISEKLQLLIALPDQMRAVLALEESIAVMSEQFEHYNHSLFLGRGSLYPIALEGALKLKEISYIHAEGYAAGELKHGPLALVDHRMPVIALAPFDEMLGKLKANIQEVRARGGQVFVFSDKRCQITLDDGTQKVALEAVDPLTAPILFALPVQLLAYHVALIKGTDVDQPRNLAKSVTVE